MNLWISTKEEKKSVYKLCVFLYMNFIYQSITYMCQNEFILKKDNILLQKDVNLCSVAAIRLWCIKNHSIILSEWNLSHKIMDKYRHILNI